MMMLEFLFKEVGVAILGAVNTPEAAVIAVGGMTAYFAREYYKINRPTSGNSASKTVDFATEDDRRIDSLIQRAKTIIAQKSCVP